MGKNFATFLENKIKETRKENVFELVNNLNSPQVEKKLLSFIDKWQDIFPWLNLSLLKEEIKKENPWVVCLFAKEPLKQNISERAICEFLDIEKLPVRGKNSVCFNSFGEIVPATKDKLVSKSADFYIDGRYYTQKYTREEGGAQDNQFHDVVLFLENGSKKNKVGAILDGSYWIEKGNLDHIKLLFQDNENVIILTADELLSQRSK